MLCWAAALSCSGGATTSESTDEPRRVEVTAAGAQVTGLAARHRVGQTLLTFREIEPTLTGATATVGEVRELRKALFEEKELVYRVYRSRDPITSVQNLKPIGEVQPLSGWNVSYWGEYAQADRPVRRYVVEDGKDPVPPGTAVYAHNPREAGPAHYAVTVVSGGRENVLITPGNSVAAPVAEEVGEGEPVLQRIDRPPIFQQIEGATARYYVRWVSSSFASIPGKPYDYVVAIPPGVKPKAPVGLHLHHWGGNLNDGYGWWFNGSRGAVLIATNQDPYDWWTGYHEHLWTGKLKTPEDWKAGVVRPYTQRRLIAFLDWVGGKFDVDLSRAFVAGTSMGGSGSIMLALRYPDRFAWTMSWVGVHSPAQSPQYKDSYEQVYGKHELNVGFEDGSSVWEYFDDPTYLRRHPGQEIGFITFANGKTDNAIGWKQSVDFYRAMQDTKRPHIFIWGQAGHGQRSFFPAGGGEQVMPLDLQIRQSVPAFTRSTLDGNPGDGRQEDGDPAGQSNLFVFWDTKDIVDAVDRWEMTVGLTGEAPADSCRVDVTPRRTQQFRATPGQRFTWTNTPLGGGAAQRGDAIADEHGLVTMPQVTVGKGKNRLRLTRS
jgi:pimeloyl-ACP methyl ester carboxylesterase